MKKTIWAVSTVSMILMLASMWPDIRRYLRMRAM
jgi:hypothetical protein